MRALTDSRHPILPFRFGDRPIPERNFLQQDFGSCRREASQYLFEVDRPVNTFDIFLSDECLRPQFVPPDENAEIEASVLKGTFDRFVDAKGHDGKAMQQVSRVLDEAPGITFGKGRTRAFADDQTKHTVYSGLRFTAEALASFVPETADRSKRVLVDQRVVCHGDMRDSIVPGRLTIPA